MVLMARPLSGSPGFDSCNGQLTSTDPLPPRNSAAAWQTVLDQLVTPYYLNESYDALTWQFKVVANPQPGTNGWWPAKQCSAYSGNNFSPTSMVADAAQRMLHVALAARVISDADVLNSHNFIMMDNRQTNEGQTDVYGRIEPYQVQNAEGVPLAFTVRSSVVGEGLTDGFGVGIIEHELGNQLNLPELYTSPCQWAEPGGNPPPDDCVGYWDMAALNSNGFGVYERMLAGWLSPNSVRLEPQSWSGWVSVSPLERPNGDKLALILSTQSLLPPGAAQPPSPGPPTWQGYIVECRRQIDDDTNLPSGGLLVSYFDTTRGGNEPEVVVRRMLSLSVDDAALNTYETYLNTTLGVRVTYIGDAHNGSCIATVNLGTVFLVGSVESGLVLDVPFSSTLPGALIQQEQKNGGTNELWTLDQPAGATSYEIASLNSGLVLDVPAPSNVSGTKIRQWNTNGNTNQQWTLRGKGWRIFEVPSVNSGLVLDVFSSSKHPGTQIDQWTEIGGTNQQWTFTPPGFFTAGGFFRIPHVSIFGQSNATGANMKISGKNFSPGDGLHSHFMGVPGNQSGPDQFVQVDANGMFSVTTPIGFSSNKSSDASGYVAVVMQTGEGRVLAIGSVSAGYWVTNDPCWPIKQKIADLQEQLSEPNPPVVARALREEIRLQELALKACLEGH